MYHGENYSANFINHGLSSTNSLELLEFAFSSDSLEYVLIFITFIAIRGRFVCNPSLLYRTRINICPYIH